MWGGAGYLGIGVNMNFEGADLAPLKMAREGNARAAVGRVRIFFYFIFFKGLRKLITQDGPADIEQWQVFLKKIHDP